MKSAILLVILLISLCSEQCDAGSRGVSLAFVDATAGQRSKEGLRLAELLVRDMRRVYVDADYAQAFPWSESDAEITVLEASDFSHSFDRLLNGGKASDIKSVLIRKNVQDGVIVYNYDRKHGFVRLKLFDSSGAECLLVRLPLEAGDSTMKHSVLKHVRRGALLSIGASVRWNP